MADDLGELGAAPGQRLEWLTAASVAAIAVVLIAASSVLVTLGVLRSSSGEEGPDEAPDILVAIEAGSLRSLVSGTIRRVPRATFTVAVSGTVTKDGALAGVIVEEGDALTWISQRPVILLRGSAPASRDLGPGSRGSDVRNLQQSLVRLGYKVPVNGRYGASTARAVYAMYRELGARPRLAGGGTATKQQAHLSTLPLAEYVFSPTGAVQTVDPCGRWGQRVSGDLCGVQTVAATLVLDVPASQAASVAEGQQVLFTVGGEQRTATVRGAYEAGAPKDPASVAEFKRFVIEPDGELSTPELLSVQGLGQVVVATAADQFLVPAAAVHDDGTRTWLVPEEGGILEVRLGLCASGRCAVSGDALQEGRRIVVSAGP